MAKSTTLEQDVVNLGTRVRELEVDLRRAEQDASTLEDRAEEAESKLGRFRDLERAVDERLPAILDACPTCKDEPERGVKRAFCAICKPVTEILNLSREL